MVPEGIPSVPERTPHHEPAGATSSAIPGGSLRTIQSEVEQRTLEKALTETRGNLSRAAALLGVSRQRLSSA